MKDRIACHHLGQEKLCLPTIVAIHNPKEKRQVYAWAKTKPLPYVTITLNSFLTFSTLWKQSPLLNKQIYNGKKISKNKMNSYYDYGVACSLNMTLFTQTVQHIYHTYVQYEGLLLFKNMKLHSMPLNQTTPHHDNSI